MRESLAKWVNDADALHHIEQLGITQDPEDLEYLHSRRDDYYISLVGELIDRIKNPYNEQINWSVLGNAILQVSAKEKKTKSKFGILSPEAALFAAASFYLGGYSASAYLTLKTVDSREFDKIQLACFELLARPSSSNIRSTQVRTLINALQTGSLQSIQDESINAESMMRSSLFSGPDEWVGWVLFKHLLDKFQKTNLRAVLPDGENELWYPLIESLLERTPPAWDFFPSQIDAINKGLLDSSSSFSIQMPTGAGKTALTETLLYYHLKQKPHDQAILLVPYRSIAAELRKSLAERLKGMSLPIRCVYGGTVPLSYEVQDLDQARAVLATPESLSGLLSANPELLSNTSLVICDH